MSSTDEQTGETPRFTFRFPAGAVDKLDDLVGEFQSEESQRQTRTSVLLKLIDREHARRTKNREKR